MSILQSMVPYPGLKVMISAGADGIGAVIAQAFAETGAEIHVCDVNEAALARFAERFPGALTSLVDVADGKAVAAMFEAQKERFGGLDVLVNNAGIAGTTAGIDSVDETSWERTVDVNLNSQYRFTHHAVPMLRKSKHANIICMSSVAGRLGYSFRTPYSSTKWAVVGLMKSLACELGPEDIRVNAILPGIVEGPRMDGVIESRARTLGISVAEMRDQYLSKISLRRMVTPEEVAALILYLNSPAGHSVTGQAISVDGNLEYL